MKNALFAILLLCSIPAFSQSELRTDSSLAIENPQSRLPLFSLEPATDLHKGRLWLSAGTGAVIYTGLAALLWNAWYKDYPLGSFHTFNDWGEWLHMDKSGHLFSAYTASTYSFQGARWTGMKSRKAMWTSIAIGSGIQATIEVMDGFSEEWGFSLGDIAFNTMGVSLFAAQEMLWQEQRILMKASGIRPDYSKQALLSSNSSQSTTLNQRAADLYGTTPFHVILKDYNALTVWASFNIRSFVNKDKASWLPEWLNLAVGYGAENLYGGFGNEWTENGATYQLDSKQYPRYWQFFLSPDIDFRRIPTKHRWVRFSLGLLNWMKFPAPALELTSQGSIRLRSFYW